MRVSEPPAKQRTGSKMKPPRERLRELRERSGMTGSAVARLAGYSHASGYTNYEQPKHGNRPIPYRLIKQLIPLWRGKGSPAITVDELLAISDGADESTVVKQAVAQRLEKTATRIDAAIEAGSAEVVPLRMRAERGTYIDPNVKRDTTTSRVAYSPEYDMSVQFCVSVVDRHAQPWFKQHAHLHCVDRAEFSDEALHGRRVVCLVWRDATGLAEVLVAKATVMRGETTLMSAEDVLIDGEIVGVIVGAYVRE